MEGEISKNNIVIGQQATEEKRRLAEQMRRKMTPMEYALWQKLRRSQLGVNFRRQQIINGFIADFYCHGSALVVEVDGPVHNADYDAERDRILAHRDLRILRVTNDQVRTDIGSVLHKIRQVLVSEST